MRKAVSIVTPMYNSERFISEAVLSVLAQTYSDWEMIIVDDKSSDRSADVVVEFARRDSRIRLLCQEKNLGPAAARNRGIAEAQGRHIAFLDSDDRWLPEKLERQLAFMRENDAALSYTAYYRIDEKSGRRTGEVRIPRSVDYRELLKQNIIGCLTAIYDTEKVGKVYMPELRKRQDFGLWLKILRHVPAAYGLDEPLAEYRVRSSDSVSSNKLKASLYNWRLYREAEKLPLHKAVYYFGWYTYRSLMKYGGR